MTRPDPGREGEGSLTVDRWSPRPCRPRPCTSTATRPSRRPSRSSTRRAGAAPASSCSERRSSAATRTGRGGRTRGTTPAGSRAARPGGRRSEPGHGAARCRYAPRRRVRRDRDRRAGPARQHDLQLAALPRPRRRRARRAPQAHADRWRTPGLGVWRRFRPRGARDAVRAARRPALLGELHALARAAVYAQGCDVYVAPTWDNSDAWVPTLRHIAKEGRMHVIGVTPCQRGSDVRDTLEGFDALYGGEDDWLSRGNSTIVGPEGDILAGPLVGETGISTPSSTSPRRGLAPDVRPGRPLLASRRVPAARGCPRQAGRDLRGRRLDGARDGATDPSPPIRPARPPPDGAVTRSGSRARARARGRRRRDHDARASARTTSRSTPSPT